MASTQKPDRLQAHFSEAIGDTNSYAAGKLWADASGRKVKATASLVREWSIALPLSVRSLAEFLDVVGFELTIVKKKKRKTENKEKTHGS